MSTDKDSSAKDKPVIELLKNAIETKEGMNKPLVVEFDLQMAGREIEQGQIDKYLRPPFSAEIMIVMQAEIVYHVNGLL